jgi:HSP20 family protein
MTVFTRLHTNRLRPSSLHAANAADLFSHNDLFAHFFRPSSHAAPEIRLDVSEDAKAYYVAAALAGVKKDDIHVSVEKNEVTIEAEIKPLVRAESNDGIDRDSGDALTQGGVKRVLHSERFYGKTSRSFALAQEIDEAAVEAAYVDGVLTLVLPKQTATAAKRIAIN